MANKYYYLVFSTHDNCYKMYSIAQTDPSIVNCLVIFACLPLILFAIVVIEDLFLNNLAHVHGIRAKISLILGNLNKEIAYDRKSEDFELKWLQNEVKFPQYMSEPDLSNYTLESELLSEYMLDFDSEEETIKKN